MNVRCEYCDHPIVNFASVPSVDDDATWTALAAEHAPGCEWITTRAWRVNSTRPKLDLAHIAEVWDSLDE